MWLVAFSSIRPSPKTIPVCPTGEVNQRNLAEARCAAVDGHLSTRTIGAVGGVDAHGPAVLEAEGQALDPAGAANEMDGPAYADDTLGASVGRGARRSMKRIGLLATMPVARALELLDRREVDRAQDAVCRVQPTETVTDGLVQQLVVHSR